MLILHNAIYQSMQSIKEHCLTGFIAKTPRSRFWSCFIAVLPFCPEIVKKKVSLVRHAVSCHKAVYDFSATMEKYQTITVYLICHPSQTAKDRLIFSGLRNRFLYLDTCRTVEEVTSWKSDKDETVKFYSLSSSGSFLESLTSLGPVTLPDL